MGKIILKQSPLSLGFSFNGFGKKSETLYSVRSGYFMPMLDRLLNTFISVPNTVKIKDLTDGRTLILKKKFGFLFENYTLLSESGEVIAKIDRSKKMVKAEVKVESVYGEFLVKSNLMARTFKIYQSNMLIADIKKVVLSLKDSYEISYRNDNVDGLVIVALMVAVDNMFHS